MSDVLHRLHAALDRLETSLLHYGREADAQTHELSRLRERHTALRTAVSAALAGLDAQIAQGTRH